MDFMRCDRCKTLIQVEAEYNGHPEDCWMTIKASRVPGWAHPANKIRHSLCRQCYTGLQAFLAGGVVQVSEVQNAG